MFLQLMCTEKCCRNKMVSLDVSVATVFRIEAAGLPITSKVSTLSCLVVSCGFMVMDRTVFSAICCAWPLRWWSTGRVTPGRTCSKSSLLVLGRDGRVQSLAACWGIDQTLSQRPNAESPARREGHAGCAAILVFEALSKTSAASLHE